MDSKFFNIQGRIIKKDNIVLIEESGDELNKYKLKILLKGEFSIELIYENYDSIEYDLDILKGINYIMVQEFSLDYQVISTCFINLDYLSAISLSEITYEDKKYINAYFLLTDCIEEPYPIITKFKTIEEGVEYFGLS